MEGNMCKFRHWGKEELERKIRQRCSEGKNYKEFVK
jgi:hypothetical protein